MIQSTLTGGHSEINETYIDPKTNVIAETNM